MAPPCDALSKVYPEREAWRFKVRVIRLWTIPTFNNPSQPSSVEMVLIDEFGGKIQATVRKTLIYKFLPVLQEGSVYQMSYFSVTPNIGQYKSTTHEYRLLFQFRTKVNACESSIIPMHGLSLVTFQHILRNEAYSEFLVVSSGKEYERDGKTTKMVVAELSDYENKLEVALFGEYVDQINDFIAAGNFDMPVMVIQFAKVKLFRGKIVLQNVMHASKLMFNPPIAEVIEFRNGLNQQGVVPIQSIGVFADAPKVSLEEDFMRQHPKRSIQQLLDNKEDGVFIVMATIDSFVEDCEWWYPACRCHKAVIPDSGLYYCNSCVSHVVNVTLRYKIKVKVQDASGNAVFVLFYRDGQHLLKRGCAELVGEKQKGTHEGIYPAAFDELIGKKMLFKVESKSTSTALYDGSFRVKRVCDDETILSMFLLDGADLTPTKAIFTPPFPDMCSIGSQDNELDSTAAKEFVSDLIVSPVCLSSIEVPIFYNKTPVKKNLETTIDGANCLVQPALKKVKLEKE